jgi:AICAR transformylase/IMP cyclohydrolase PurH
VAEKKSIELEDRKRLSAKVFAHTGAYDTLVAKELGAGWGKNEPSPMAFDAMGAAREFTVANLVSRSTP